MKLGKLKMPEKKKPNLAQLDEQPMDMEMSEDEAPMGGEEALAGEAEAGEMADEAAAPAELDMVSDDDLMAEVQKRGLMGKLPA